jgi:hypothetical protein
MDHRLAGRVSRGAPRVYQYALALVCLAAAAILLSAKIIQSAISHEPHSSGTRGVWSVISALTAIREKTFVRIGMRNLHACHSPQMKGITSAPIRP